VSNNKELQPLMMLSPFLYQELLGALEKENIHSFDIEAYGCKHSDEIEIEVSFGEGFQKVMKETFPLVILKEKNDKYLNFCTNIGETCKKIMIDDYFKMVKP